MKVLIVGASSFIGFRLYDYINSSSMFEAQGTYFTNKLDNDFLYLDITEKNQIESVLKNYFPDVIVWIAGSKNLKKCESELEYSKKINYYPIKYLIETYEKLNLESHFIFLSTDYVYDGVEGGYLDTDIPNPNTNYGLSNLLAEKEIIKCNIEYSIIRTSAVMGKGGTFFDWITKELSKNKSIELLDNIYFSPTPIELLLEYIIDFIKYRKTGVFNICGKQRLTRYEFGVILKSRNKNFIADLIATKSTQDMLYLQPDLSMIPSQINHSPLNKTLIDYLDEELNND